MLGYAYIQCMDDLQRFEIQGVTSKGSIIRMVRERKHVWFAASQARECGVTQITVRECDSALITRSVLA